MIVADTHTWIWWSDDPGRLSEAARGAMETADRILVSAISCLELATLARRGRLVLDRRVETWMTQALAPERVEAIPVTPALAARAGSLPDAFPGDPADRVIYSTALASSAKLVTRDARIRDYDPTMTLW